MSLQQLSEVFGGKIKNWLDLGGPDAPIALHLLGRESGFAQAVEDQLMKRVNLMSAEDVIRHTRNDALVSAVLRDPFVRTWSRIQDDRTISGRRL